MYAVDMQGDWKWGHFFYNTSVQINHFTGCTMDSRGMLMVTGLADATNVKPFVAEINTKTGKPFKFLFIEKIVADDFTEYITTTGMHYDDRDPRDGKPYYYMSLVYNNKQIQIIKIDSTDGSVKWSYQYMSKQDINT